MPAYPGRLSIHRILVGVDFSEAGHEALRYGLEVVDQTSGAEPHVVHVAAAFGPVLRLSVDDDVRAMTIDGATDYLREYVSSCIEELKAERPPRFDVAITHLRVGSPADEIVELAQEIEANLVIVGTHGRSGVRRLVLGSVAESVVRRAPCPVLVVRQRLLSHERDAHNGRERPASGMTDEPLGSFG
jgi:nucleotide-binding universal stress UspA family protein